jgi:E3 ubiquitin-protein ligase SHPRH
VVSSVKLQVSVTHLTNMVTRLARLRQSCVHPEVGGGNRRALGSNENALRTVDQVLEVMMEQNNVSIRTEQRALLLSKLKRGQLFENGPRVKEAFEIWDDAAREASVIVEECREALRIETARISIDNKPDAQSADVSYDDSDSPEKPEE